MKEYNCPDCERTDSCEGCQRVLLKGIVTVSTNDFGVRLYKFGYLDITSVPDSCKACSNHPVNGGSGICHCILGLATIN
jgi:hypothetical protein